MKKLLALTTLILAAFTAQAETLSPEGVWKTIDDETGKAKSLVQIWIDNGELKGKIIELIEPDEENPKCTECEGDLKDAPILGMEFIWGLKEEDGVWDNGNILDPASGSVYSSKIEVIEDGAKLDVRGYIGFAFAGRSQIWEKAEAPKTETVKATEETAAVK